MEELPPLTPLLSGDELVLLPAGLPKSACPCRIRAQRCRRLSSRLRRQMLPVESKFSAHSQHMSYLRAKMTVALMP